MKSKKDKIKAEYCPRCTDEVMVESRSGDMEVFECENCKFKFKRKKSK